MRWPWRTRSASLVSVSDPAFAAYFGAGLPNHAGVEVTESTALGLSAVWRCVALISETIASLPTRTVRDVDGQKQRVSSFLDDPGRVDGLTRFNFWETTLCHLLLHGNAFLVHRFNGAGAVAGLFPLHPLCVTVEWNPAVPGSKVFRAALRDGSVSEFDATTMTHVMGKSLDGLVGLSPITVARNSLGTSVAGDRAAARMFASGAMVSGLVTPEDDLEESEAVQVKQSLDRSAAGWENAGGLALINRRLKFHQWSMSAEDAQFLQSRAFQIEEVARWFGIPPFALMQTEKQTSWGTGIESQQRGLGRTVLAPWTVRIQEAVSPLLPSPRKFEWDFSGLERATPAEEIRLLLEQVRGGLLTVNEARAIRNLPPVAGGDTPVRPEAGGVVPAAADDTEGVAQ